MNARLDVEHIAEKPLVVDFLHREEILVPAAVLVYGKDLSAFVCRVDHFLQIAARKCDRLFAHDIFACMQCGDRKRFVAVVRRRGENHINAFVCQHVFKAVISAVAKIAGRLLALFLDIVHTGKLQAFDAAFDQLAVPVTHSAKANNDNSVFVLAHIRNLPYAHHILSSFSCVRTSFKNVIALSSPSSTVISESSCSIESTWS